METLALIIVSVGTALLIGIPLGIWAGRNDRAEKFLRPVLDAMQTVPAFAYLLPLVLLFGIGAATAIISTLIFALPPAVRLDQPGDPRRARRPRSRWRARSARPGARPCARSSSPWRSRRPCSVSTRRS